jgi:hypothetical protein
MNTTRTAVAVSALLVATGLAAVTTAAAAPSAPSAVSSSSTASAEDQLTAVATPLLSQQAHGYQGKWAVEGGTLEESFDQDGVVVSTGTTSLRDGLAADEVVSFGYVAGFGDPDTGAQHAQHAQLSGQAGADVTAVRVVSASGVTTSATLVDGIWGAVWTAGDSADEYGPAVLQVDTVAVPAGVSTDEVDVIAAEQRAADQG